MSVPRQIMTGNRNNHLKTGKIIQNSMEFCPWPMRDVCQYFLQGVKEGFAVTSGWNNNGRMGRLALDILQQLESLRPSEHKSMRPSRVAKIADVP